jgi:hypothetical protein
VNRYGYEILDREHLVKGARIKLERTDDYVIFDRVRGMDVYLAVCSCAADAELIVDALNVARRVSPCRAHGLVTP